MAKKANAIVELEGGQQITRFTQLRLEQHLFGHHEFHLQLPVEAIEGEGNYLLNQSKQLIGKTIKLVLESDQILDTQGPPFLGIITSIGLVRSFGSSNDLLIKGRSTTALLDNGRNIRSFSEKNLEEIVNSVISEYPGNMLSAMIKPAHTTVIPYLVQHKESDFQFLMRLANYYNEWMFYNGNEIVFGSPEWAEPIPLLLGRDLYDFQLKMTLHPINYATQFYNYEKSEVYQRISSDSRVSDYDPVYGELAYNESGRIFNVSPSQTFNPLVKDQKELDTQVERHMNSQSSEMVYLTGNGDHIGLGIGGIVSITGAKAEDPQKGLENFGEYIITALNQYIGGNGDYYNSFQAIPRAAAVPPPNPLVQSSQALPEPAIVKENIDPLKLGRVRVQFYWQKGNEMTPWIRLVNTHGGKSGGFFVIPEKGDEVMVGHEHLHPDRPFVYGSIYNKNAKPADHWNESDNNIKAIKTKSGNEIILCDKGGEEEIKILNKGGTNAMILTMAEGGAISITTNNQMTLTGKNITINAEENLMMQAKNIIMSTEENVTVSATKQIITHSDEETLLVAKKDAVLTSEEGTLSLIAKQNVALVSSDAALVAQSKTDLALASETASIAIQGKINVDVTADMQVNVNGKVMANVGSDGPVIVSGSIVQLN